MATALELIKKHSVIVADTANFQLMEQYKPQDATTNPSLLLQAVNVPKYAPLIEEALEYGKKAGKTPEAKLSETMIYLSVLFGREILKIIPGRVSTEVDARLSFDTQKTLACARKIIEMYNKLGVSKDRILIKIAATWEGVRAAEVLEKEGIHCNLTLLFSFAQAVACAEAGVTLISPFVGRILDWYKKNEPKEYTAADDPGVLSVQRIYRYYKRYGYKTIVMAASFRNTGEIKQLCGCDFLTISPALLQELSTDMGGAPQILDEKSAAAACKDSQLKLDEATFRWMLNEDVMATDKLAEGIRNFGKDTIKLEEIIKGKLHA